jgi:hypothetical protein
MNTTIIVKPETLNRRLEPTGLAKPGETRGFTSTSPGLARQESAGRVFGWFWNRTNPFLLSKPGQLAGYPDWLLTLGKRQLGNGIPSLVPTAQPDSSHMQKAKPVGPISTYRCILPPQLINI